MRNDGTGRVLAAFPQSVQDDAAAVVAMLPDAEIEPNSSFSVFVGGEMLEVPGRIYNPPLERRQASALNDRQQVVLQCLYTRHHDGRVREGAVAAVAALPYSWVPPFVVQLVGEYVVEIIMRILGEVPGLEVPASPDRLRYGRFALENPEFVALTSARVRSYWDCYYRRSDRDGAYPKTWAKFDEYPGAKFMAHLRDAADDVLA